MQLYKETSAAVTMLTPEVSYPFYLPANNTLLAAPVVKRLYIKKRANCGLRVGYKNTNSGDVNNT
jgi:hypothetical protein